MPLQSGARLGPYEILSALGAGGMGEVYRARDARLGRDVAIKILAPHLGQDRDAVARFEREAQTASALNHPHIVHIYEIGEAQTAAGAVRYIAMEFVQGLTLRAHLNLGAQRTGLLEALVQVADALTKAHRAGIVHRDLKPENIMITDDGYHKVLDFGLAKLAETSQVAPGADGIATTVDGMTRTGMIVGTVGYMSPEQACARHTDKRSDIFSFGCIAYEVAAGRPAFKEESSVATLHAIAYEEPPAIESVNAQASPELCRIVRKCLAKEPEQRYQTMAAVAADLRVVTRGGPTPSPEWATTKAIARETESAGRRHPLKRDLLWSAVIIAILGGIALGLWKRASSTPGLRAPGSAIRVEKLTSRGNAGNPAISPDGRYLAYASSEEGRPGTTIWLRSIAEKTETRLVGGIDAFFGIDMIRFATDGQSIYYSLVPTVDQQPALYRVPLIGGDSRLIRAKAGGIFSPDEKHLAFTRSQAGKRRIVISEVDSEQQSDIGEVTGHGGPLGWSQDGTQLLFVRDGGWSEDYTHLIADGAKEGGYALFVVKADGTSERKIGTVSRVPNKAWWSPNGTVIVCAILKNQHDRQLVGLDVATGAIRPVGNRDWGQIDALYWLPDGTGLVIKEYSRDVPGIWRVSYPDGKVDGVLVDTHTYNGLSMSPDGTKLFAIQLSSRTDLLVSSTPEKGPFKRLSSGTGVSYSLCWTADGKIVYSSNEGGSYDLYVIDADGANRKQLTFDRPGNETAPAASPDGRYIVFVSDRSGERG